MGRISLIGSKMKGFWITPNGKIEEVETRHINDIFDNPSKFGLFIEYIHKIYNENNEKTFTEGKSRNIILNKVILGGWTRIRYNTKPECFHIETIEYDLGTQNFLYEFVSEMMLTYFYSKFEEIVLITLKDLKERRFTFQEILDME